MTTPIVDAPHASECPCVACLSKRIRVGSKVRLIGSRYCKDLVVDVVEVRRDEKNGWVRDVLVEVNGRPARFPLADIALPHKGDAGRSDTEGKGNG